MDQHVVRDGLRRFISTCYDVARCVYSWSEPA